MNIHLNILKKGAEVKHWPNVNAEHIKCTLGTKEKNWEADLHKSEVALSEALAAIQSKVTPKELAALMEAIDEYGQHNYREGGDSEAMSNAGPEL